MAKSQVSIHFFPPHGCISLEQSVPVNEVGGAIDGVNDPSRVVC